MELLSFLQYFSRDYTTFESYDKMRKNLKED